jgi:hypothetical protein
MCMHMHVHNTMHTCTYILMYTHRYTCTQMHTRIYICFALKSQVGLSISLPACMLIIFASVLFVHQTTKCWHDHWLEILMASLGYL